MKLSLQYKNIRSFFYGLVVMAVVLISCDTGSNTAQDDSELQSSENAISDVIRPDFNADSAYYHIEKQVSFGPRVPNSVAHKRCAEYLIEYFKFQGAKVTVQEAKVKDHVGNTLEIKNIIASYKPEAERRIMLSAHWDSRPRADEDSVKQHLPIDGANDGASGVGVLMEIARQLKSVPPNIGVDIFLWDAEDGGISGNNESWCLGSQYWAKNPHQPGYKAEYGINLDMVGAKNATFPKEQYSNMVAPNVVQKVWQTAHLLGHGAYFAMIDHGGITDDHYFIHRIAQIPYIDIIHIELSNQDRGFFEHWHTHGDNITVINKSTLQAVGETVLSVVRSEK